MSTNIEKEIMDNKLSSFYNDIKREQMELDRMRDLYHYMAITDYTNMTVQKINCCIAWLNHSNLSVEEIIKKCNEFSKYSHQILK